MATPVRRFLASPLQLARITRLADVDNVCVTSRLRRRGVASALVSLAADVAQAEFGARELHAHCHTHNDSARRLYAQLSFCVPQLHNSRQESLERASERMRGLLLLRAPLPLVTQQVRGPSQRCDCGAQAWRLTCVCPPSFDLAC
jgi:hypothetical protein